VIGIVICNTHEQAVKVANKIIINYEDIHPIIMSIEDAIENNSFYPDHHTILSGDMKEAVEKSELHVSGSGRLGGQGNLDNF
jgi:xanthine dehydrogenase molybdopterin-binding subunit B